MKRFLPYLYPAAVYGILILMVVFEIDPGPFIPILLIGGVGLANVLYSFQLYKEEEDRQLKLSCMAIIILLLPAILMLFWFFFVMAYFATRESETRNLILIGLGTLFFLLLPASFYLFQCIRVKKHNLFMEILSFFPIIHLFLLMFV
ncbi:MAG: hypothetical protein IKS54_10655 [Erysipelotrichaceae bacterium]|nr:hypothetical protein [Erysipelotrichaceae bacterium]